MTGFLNKNMIPLRALPLKVLTEYINSLLSFRVYALKNWESLRQFPHSADEATEARESNSFVQSQKLANLELMMILLHSPPLFLSRVQSPLLNHMKSDYSDSFKA